MFVVWTFCCWFFSFWFFLPPHTRFHSLGSVFGCCWEFVCCSFFVLISFVCFATLADLILFEFYLHFNRCIETCEWVVQNKSKKNSLASPSLSLIPRAPIHFRIIYECEWKIKKNFSHLVSARGGGRGMVCTMEMEILQTINISVLTNTVTE